MDKKLQLGKFVDVADGSVVVGVDHLTAGEDFFDKLFVVSAVLHPHKIVCVCQLRFFKEGLGMGRSGTAVQEFCNDFIFFHGCFSSFCVHYIGVWLKFQMKAFDLIEFQKML